MKKYKFQLQLAAFLAIMLASAGLYYSARLELTALVWALLGLTIAAMLVSVWIS
jgi:hypothetical protein